MAKPDNTIHTDIVVIGAGLAGCSAALKAAECGASVAVLEKSGSFGARGGHFGVVGSRVMDKAGITLDKEELAMRWIRTSGGRIKEELLWLFINKSEEAMNWLLDKTEEAGVDSCIWYGNYKGPGEPEMQGTHLFRGGASAVVRTLMEDAQKLGVKFYFKTPGKHLIMDGRRVIGAEAENENKETVRFMAEKGVILASGDIGANQELCEKYAPEALKSNGNIYTPKGCNTGDGHIMGMEAGGVMQNSMFAPTLHPQYFSGYIFGGLHVGRDGKRFMNEDCGAQAKAVNSMTNSSGKFAFSVFDADWKTYVKESLPYGGGLFWEQAFRWENEEWNGDSVEKNIENYVSGGRNGFKADTLEELAEKMGVPADNFVKSVDRYNEICAQRKDTDFGKRKVFLYPVKKPPFYGLKFGAATLCIMGGLDTDTTLHVLNENGDQIPGLFAAGNTAGSLYANDYPMALPGNSHGRALTWGYLAGRNAAEAEV